jgi:integrase
MGLADARTRAKELLAQVTQGDDPAATRRAAREAATFEELAQEYIERHAKPKKRSWHEDARIISTYVPQSWRRQPANTITRRQVRDLLDGLAEKTPIMANRVLACLRKVFNWGLGRELIDANPCAGIERPAAEHQRDRVLNPEEIRRLWKALEDEDPPTAALFRLYFLTTARGYELRTMRWDDLDLESGWWTIPAERSKNRLAHRVPLSPLAVSILRDLRGRATNSPWVFESTGPEGYRVSIQKAALRIRAATGLDFTPHDLRRTAASHLTGELKVSRLVVSKLLNHVERGVTAIYDRASYDQEKRQAVDKLARYLKAVVSAKPTEKVVELRPA